MMKSRSIAALCALMLAASCSSMDFGDSLMDAASTVFQAQDIKDCREIYKRTGDRLGLTDCETAVLR